MERTYITDYLIDADQKISDWLIKINFCRSKLQLSLGIKWFHFVSVTFFKKIYMIRRTLFFKSIEFMKDSNFAKEKIEGIFTRVLMRMLVSLFC